MASLVGRVKNLVVEDGEVESETETDRVCGSQISSSDLGSSFVGLERLVGGTLALLGDGEFGEISVVVTLPASFRQCAIQRRAGKGLLHLVIEDFGLAGLSGSDQVLVENI